MRTDWPTEKICAYAYISTPAITTCTNAGEAYLLQGIFTNEILEKFAIETFRLVYKGPKRHIKINLHGSIESSLNSTALTLIIYVNDVAQVNSQMTTFLYRKEEPLMISCIDIIELDYNDIIDIKVISDTAGAVITAQTMNAAAVKAY